MSTAKPPHPPPEAFQFRRDAQDTRIFYADAEAAAGATRKRRFAGVGYSGEVIPNHYWWGNVVFDLDSMTVPPKMAILLHHDFDKRVGYTTKADIGYAQGLQLEGDLLTNTYAQEVLSDSEEGFPWQMSVHIEPGSVEQVQAGTTIQLNGKNLTGPLTVFRNSLIRECSFCVTGHDSNTTATAFARSTAAFSQPNHEGNTMTKEEQDRMAALEAENAALQAKVKDQEQKAKEFAHAQRDATVKQLFSDLKLTFSAEAAAPYMTLDDAHFTALAAQMRNTFNAWQKAGPQKAALFMHTATTGAANSDTDNQPTSAEALRKAAEKTAQQFAARRKHSA